MNVSSLTPADASKAFAKKAKAFALENSLDFAIAWHRVKLEEPELYHQAFGAKALENSARRPSVPDGRGGERFLPVREKSQSTGTIPIPSRENIQALCLPNDASLEEFNAAFHANGGVPLRPERKHAVFCALLNLCKNWGTPAEVEKRAATRFPKLAPVS